MNRAVKSALAVMAAGALIATSACSALPRSGPLASQLAAAEPGSGAAEGLVVALDARAIAATAPVARNGFPRRFMSAPTIDPERLGVGDVLDVTIWEGAAPGLFGGTNGAATLEGVQVDASGTVFLPYAGKLRAAGSTVDALRARLRNALTPLTVAPEVDVRLREPGSRLVAIQGGVARPGVYPIDRGALRLIPLLARAGGSVLQPEQTEVSVRRGTAIGAEMLEDIYADPALDIALAPGDRIVLTAIRERFIVLGAASIQAELAFPTRELSLLSALGAARGLRDFDADPEGVFVLRRERRETADALLVGAPPEALPAGEGRPIIYQLDLTRPEAMFMASQFRMRDGDALYVANAPLTELRKFLQLFNSVAAPIQSTTTLSNSAGGL